VTGAPLALAVGATAPHGAGEQETDQFTPRFLGSFTTSALNWLELAASRFAELGFTVTVVPGTVMLAELTTAFTATDVASKVTVKSPAGKVVGAV
jgi:hypothetical protein